MLQICAAATLLHMDSVKSEIKAYFNCTEAIVHKVVLLDLNHQGYFWRIYLSWQTLQI